MPGSKQGKGKKAAGAGMVMRGHTQAEACAEHFKSMWGRGVQMCEQEGELGLKRRIHLFVKGSVLYFWLLAKPMLCFPCVRSGDGYRTN